MENGEKQAKWMRRKRKKVTRGELHAERLMVMAMKKATETETTKKLLNKLKSKV